MPAVLERERVADACTWVEYCSLPATWEWSARSGRVYPPCEEHKQEQEAIVGPVGTFRRIAEPHP